MVTKLYGYGLRGLISVGEDDNYRGHALRLLGSRLAAVLESYCSGYFVIESDTLNELYLLLQRRLEELAEPYPKVQEALHQVLQIAPNLYESWEVADAYDELLRPVLATFKARLGECYLDHFTAEVQLAEPDRTLAKTCGELLQSYDKRKRAHQERWVAKAEQAGREFQEGVGSHPATTPAPSESAHDIDSQEQNAGDTTLAKKPTPEPLPLPTLTVPRTEAARRIQERITLGQQLRDQAIVSKETLKEAEASKYNWSDYNTDLLRHIFSNRTFAEEYSRGVGFAVIRQTTLTEDIGEYRDNVSDKLRRLESILGRLELIPESVPILPSAGHSNRISSSHPTEHGYAFILMTMSEDHPELEDVHLGMKRACHNSGFRGERVDDIEHTQRITEKIIECIDKAEVVIADLTFERPNVYYELGYAHGIRKPVILVAKQGTVLHFDVRDFKASYFKNVTDLEQQLHKRLSALRAAGS